MNFLWRKSLVALGGDEKKFLIRKRWKLINWSFVRAKIYCEESLTEEIQTKAQSCWLWFVVQVLFYLIQASLSSLLSVSLLTTSNHFPIISNYLSQPFLSFNANLCHLSYQSRVWLKFPFCSSEKISNANLSPYIWLKSKLKILRKGLHNVWVFCYSSLRLPWIPSKHPHESRYWKIAASGCRVEVERKEDEKRLNIWGIFQYLFLQTLNNQFILFSCMFEMKIHKLLDERKRTNFSNLLLDVFFNFIAFSLRNFESKASSMLQRRKLSRESRPVIYLSLNPDSPG